MRLLDDITDSMDMGLSKLQEMLKNSEAWHDAVHGVAKNLTQLSNWTELNYLYIYVYKSFSTTLDKGLRKNIKNKRDGEIGKHKLNEMETLNMKYKK